MSVTCPKCGYVRQPHDTAPDYECPKCGIVYAKFKPPSKPVEPEVTAPAPDLPPVTERAEQPVPDPIESIPHRTLRECPDCAGIVSREAITCPHCGCPLQYPNEQIPLSVSVVDFNMAFGSMVTFMLRWALASIPAFLILVLFFAGVTAGFTAIVGALR